MASLTVAPGGGVNPNTESAGVAVENEVKPTWKAGVDAPRANTWTRVGMWVEPSIAIRTDPTRERESRGTRSSWYAGRPATCGGRVGGDLRGRPDRREHRGRRLLGCRSRGGRTLAEESCSGLVGLPVWSEASAGTVQWVAVLVWLDQAHTSEP